MTIEMAAAKLLVLACLLAVSMAFDFYQPKYTAPRVGVRADNSIKNVHIIFMNHLDVGYDGIPGTGLINNVINTYFTEYFPRAVKLNADLTNFGFTETFKYTTHPWLVDLYLNCPPNFVLSGVKLKCPSQKELDIFENAVKTGVIQWHAGPMNMYYEIMDPIVLEMSLNISARLDAHFGLKKPLRVISQRDVPGVTVGAVPHLVKHGVLGITNGINSGSAPPQMPPISRWSYAGSEVIFMQNPGGYPNVPGPYPANPGGAGVEQCRWVKGMTDVLCWAFRTDNHGPPDSYNEVLSNYEIMRAAFPKARLFASSLETFFSLLSKHKDAIPVVTGEMDNTWVQGAASDPRKMAEYKAFVRTLGACRNAGQCNFEDPRLVNASRFIVKLAEHTYGLNTAGDSSHWTNYQFAQIRNNANIKVAESSWLEQRNITYTGMDALGSHPVLALVKKAMSELKAERPSVEKGGSSSFQQTCSGKVSASVHFAVDGSIDNLVVGGKSLVSSPGRLGQVMYRTYNETDTGIFLHYYSMGWNTGFGKPGSTKAANPQSRWWPLAADLIVKRAGTACSFDVRVRSVDAAPEVWYGAAQEYWISFDIGVDVVNVTMQWFNKTTTRLMEAVYVNFSPDGRSTDWSISKVGNPIDPYTVVQNGSQWQQGVDDSGVTLKTGQYRIQVRSLDTVFVSPVTSLYGPTVWPAPLAPIPKSPGITGMAFNVYNNVWNTNFIYWYPFVEEDTNHKSRFQVKWSPADATLRFRPRPAL